MKINVITNVTAPDIPPLVEISGNTLREALKAALSKTAVFPDQSVMDKKDFSFEEVLELELNGKPYYSYEKGLDTQIKEADEMKLYLIFLGGG
ncbi:MAG: hypothetical protein LBT84_08095 [Spirochaetia bacterium]|jgi:hypothetical protein|nr:hypothetical protein [Spirochaetia bacterium]